MPAHVFWRLDESADPDTAVVALRAVRPHAAPGQAAGGVVLKFQWDALRRGDTVFVHNARDADLRLRAGLVTLVDVRPSGHDLGIRLTTFTRTGPVVRPGRFAVHLAAMDDHDCWRCSDNRPQRTDIGVDPGRELSRVR
jgi:hypothetical protein